MAIAGISSTQAYQPPPPRPASAASDVVAASQPLPTQASQQQVGSAAQNAAVRVATAIPASDISGPAGVQDALSLVSSAQGDAQAQAQTSQDQAQSANASASPLNSAAAAASASATAAQSAGFLAYGASGAAQDYGSGLPRGNSYNAIA